jgi:predicted Zn-dependent peptidase
MNAILGGLFSSRINLNLREQHGFTYGASSAFDWRQDGSTFGISTAVRLNATAPAISEILSEIDRIRREAVSDAELSLAVDYLQGVFPLRYETTAALADALATLVAFGLPDDFFDRYRPSILAVSKESVLQAAQRFLAPEHLRIALVSEPAIADALGSLGAGEVKVFAAN